MCSRRKKLLSALLTMLISCVVCYYMYKIGYMSVADAESWLLIIFLFFVPLIPLAIWRPRPYKIGALVGAVVAYVLLCFVPSPRDLFLRDLYSAKPGMTVAQVERIMKPYKVWSRGDGHGISGSSAGGPVWLHEYTGDARSTSPTSDITHIAYRHSDTPMYGGDIGSVCFRRGRVIRVQFSPD